MLEINQIGLKGPTDIYNLMKLKFLQHSSLSSGVETSTYTTPQYLVRSQIDSGMIE